jgi:hypothetical protein
MARQFREQLEEEVELERARRAQASQAAPPPPAAAPAADTLRATDPAAAGPAAAGHSVPGTRADERGT